MDVFVLEVRVPVVWEHLLLNAVRNDPLWHLHYVCLQRDRVRYPREQRAEVPAGANVLLPQRELADLHREGVKVVDDHLVLPAVREEVPLRRAGDVRGISMSD